jgi:hypothetical protein
MEFLFVWIGLPVIGYLVIQGSGTAIVRLLGGEKKVDFNSLRSTVVGIIFTAIVCMALWFAGLASLRNV